MEIKGKKGPEPFVADEHPREATLDKLGQLPPVFKEGGVVTAGNASVREGRVRGGMGEGGGAGSGVDSPGLCLCCRVSVMGPRLWSLPLSKR